MLINSILIGPHHQRLCLLYRWFLSLCCHGDIVLQIRVWGRSPVNLKKCVDDITAIVGGGGAHVTAHQDVFEAVSEADVIVTVTRASEPILHGEWMKPGTLVCGQICVAGNV